MHRNTLLLTSLTLAAGLHSLSQAQNTPQPTPDHPAPTALANAPTTYLQGPGDQLSVYVADLPDEFADKTFRIDSAGDLSLPIAGHVHAAGLTTSSLEPEIQAHLTVMKYPQVTVSLVSFGSQSVSVLGAVNSPGIRQLEGQKVDLANRLLSFDPTPTKTRQ